MKCCDVNNHPSKAQQMTRSPLSEQLSCLLHKKEQCHRCHISCQSIRVCRWFLILVSIVRVSRIDDGLLRPLDDSLDHYRLRSSQSNCLYSHTFVEDRSPKKILRVATSTTMTPQHSRKGMHRSHCHSLFSFCLLPYCAIHS